MELKDGEFRFESRVKGNGITMFGHVDFSSESKKWISEIEGNKYKGYGDCSHDAIIDVIKNWMRK